MRYTLPQHLYFIIFEEVTERERDGSRIPLEHFSNTSCYTKEFPLFVPKGETDASWF